MKKNHVFHIALIAILFSACSPLLSVQETQQNNGNQTAHTSSQTAQASANPVVTETGVKRSSTFVNLKEEQTNSPKSEPPSQARNAVCPHPDKPCANKDKEFAEWELSFKLPAKIAPNKTYTSAPFYAVLLKTYKSVEDCDGGEFIEAVEKERKEFQNLEPERKVFASYGCPNMDAAGYDFDGRWDKAKETMLIDNFIAVYAGETAEEAEVLRRSVRDEYPKAVVKKMTVSWERIEQ